MSIGWDDKSRYSYGGGHGRFFIAKVVKEPGDDPEQAHRLAIQPEGYQHSLSPDDVHWARQIASPHIPQKKGKGIGGGVPEKDSYVFGFYATDQVPVYYGTIGRGEDENGNFNGTASDIPRHARDERRDGGDYRYVAKPDSDDESYDDKPILEYAINEAPRDDGSKAPMPDAEKDPSKAWTLSYYV